MDDVLTDIRRITDACALPLSWMRYRLGRRVQHRPHRESFAKMGAAGLHIEDQVQAKRCGHRRQRGRLQQEMVDRIKAAVDARTDAAIRIMARTDALAVEGIERGHRARVACVEAGADMIFPEAMTELGMYRRFKEAVGVPILANITEFGQTPLYTREELGSAGVDICLHCCSAYGR